MVGISWLANFFHENVSKLLTIFCPQIALSKKEMNAFSGSGMPAPGVMENIWNRWKSPKVTESAFAAG